MKSIIQLRAALIGIFLLSVHTINAQMIEYGFNGAVNLSNIIHSDKAMLDEGPPFDSYKTTPGIRGAIGVNAAMKVTENLRLRSDLAFNNRSALINFYEYRGSFFPSVNDYVLLPDKFEVYSARLSVYADYSIQNSLISFHAGLANDFFNKTVVSYSKGNEPEHSSKENNNIRFKDDENYSVLFGIEAGTNRLRVAADYYWGITNIYADKDSEYELFMHTFELKLIYWMNRE